MSELPATPGSIILEDEPEFYPEDGSRYMGRIWQLQNDGMWLHLTDDGMRGARAWPRHFDPGFRVLYEAKADPRPLKEFYRAQQELVAAEDALLARKHDVEGLQRHVERLRKACEESTHD